MAQPTIGFIGMGLMGVPMTLRLLGAGYEVRVWNRSIDKCAGVVSAGAILTDKLDDLVRHSDIVMLCVTDTAAVSDIVFGEAGVANSARAGQVLVDFSSIEPQATQMMAERLYTTSGCIWIDAPVSGGVAGAEQGTLAIMAGGPEDVLATIRPVLAPLSQRVTRVGDVGSGQVTKICNQMLVSCNVLVMAEVMALAEKAGVDAEQIPVALKGGFADSIPLQLTGPRMAKRDFDEVKWHVKTLLKDLDMASNLAKIMNSSAPMVGLGAELMRLHASQGNAERDPCTLVSMYVEKPE
ncbi:2-hydroxy-3-oxopropionate reductase [Thalassolituus oleivorans]|uniref:NAD(P)-dependent oxidoreductase n=1 Tax=Thalassolituus oleivorans TaxID=187493 RepID=UPI0009492F41|nr:NAD(P)-dependent oxidoreductase [Thalassolituus oleivorans]APR67802.1 2-hydroxy-3-oxopropionate reductase [Thalassolituus oleivorans]